MFQIVKVDNWRITNRMIRNFDTFDKLLVKQISDSPGISSSQLFELLEIPLSTLRYRLTTLELSGIIVVKKSRNANMYYLAEQQGGPL